MDGRRNRRRGRVGGVLLALLMLVGVGCSGPAPDREPEAPHVVSFEGAAWRLDGLDPLERADQVRDWARIGLAGRLGLDRDRLLDAFYDTTPVRDPVLTDLVDQPTGPGRSLFDGSVLHLLVPEGDPNRSRTIGHLLDQFRVDAGSDAATTQVHRYREPAPVPEVELLPEPPVPTAELRAANGWVETRIADAAALDGFLAATSSLSRLERRPDGLWAAGWSWPVDPSARVTVADVAVLQRGYGPDGGTLPGFSLDPGPAPTVEDVRAILPGLRPDLAPRVLSGDWAGSGFASVDEVRAAVGDAVFRPEAAAALPARGLPGDRTELWALQQLLDGGSPYRQARYDGGLAGSEVGMTLFYTDLVAKDWTAGVGTGVPDRAIAGFVPDPKAVIPPGLCPPDGTQGESGRLWFGQHDSAFGYAADSVDIGGRATRLYSRANGAGGEVEPSYRFGRGLRWWDQHYGLVADHEPQYARLEQIMRWSGALDWLRVAGFGEPGATLPPLPPAAGPPLRFADWYAAHPNLRERAPLVAVAPPSATQESILNVPSDPVQQCGNLSVQGGVSLAGRVSTGSGVLPRAADSVPAPMRRARLDPDASRVDPATRNGQVVERTGAADPADRVLRSIDNSPDHAAVTSTGAPRSSLPSGEAALRGSAREARQELRTDGPDVSFDLRVQKTDHGTLTATTSGNRTDLVLRPGIFTRMTAAVSRLVKAPERGLAADPGLGHSYPTRDGTTGMFVEGWLEQRPAPTGRPDSVTVIPERGAPFEIGPVVPETLTQADVAALVPGPPVVVAFSEVADLTRDAPVFRGEPGELAAGTPAAIVAEPAPLSPAHRVLVRPARIEPRRDVSQRNELEDRSWNLDRTAMAGFAPSGAPMPGEDMSVAVPLSISGGGPPGSPPAGTPGGAPGGPVEIGPAIPGVIFLVVACDEELAREEPACA